MASLTSRSKTPKNPRSKTPKNPRSKTPKNPRSKTRKQSRSKTRKQSRSKKPRAKPYIKHKQQLEQIIKKLIETAKKENKQIDLNPFNKNTILVNKLEDHLKTNKESKLRLVDLRLLAATIMDEEQQKHDCFLHGYNNKYNKVDPKKIIHPIITVDDEDADFNDETLVQYDFLSDDRPVCGESKDKLKCLKKGEEAAKTKSKPMPPKDCGKTIGSTQQYIVGHKRPIKIDPMSPVHITSPSLTPTPTPKQHKTTPQPTPSNTEDSPKSVMTPLQPLPPTSSSKSNRSKSNRSKSNPFKTKSKTGGAKYKSKTRKKNPDREPKKKRR